MNINFFRTEIKIGKNRMTEFLKELEFKMFKSIRSKILISFGHMKRMYATRTHRSELELKFTWKSMEGHRARWFSQVLQRITKKEKNK